MNGTGKEDEMEENKVPTTGAEETKTPTFDEMLSDKAMQAEYDRRMQKALNTAKEKWQAEAEAEKAEAEKLANMKAEEKLQYELAKEKENTKDAVAKLKAYELKEEALKKAQEKNIPVGLLELVNFMNSDSEKVENDLNNLQAVFSAELQKAINEKLKQTPPTAGGAVGTVKKEIPHVF